MRRSSSIMFTVAWFARNVVVREPFGDWRPITSRMSFERFWTMTPFLRTSSGNRGNASCTRLLIWNTALSMSVPTSKVAVIATPPSAAAVDAK
jgi:hypothetical protein